MEYGRGLTTVRNRFSSCPSLYEVYRHWVNLSLLPPSALKIFSPNRVCLSAHPTQTQITNALSSLRWQKREIVCGKPASCFVFACPSVVRHTFSVQHYCSEVHRLYSYDVTFMEYSFAKIEKKYFHATSPAVVGVTLYFPSATALLNSLVPPSKRAGERTADLPKRSAIGTPLWLWYRRRRRRRRSSRAGVPNPQF